MSLLLLLEKGSEKDNEKKEENENEEQKEEENISLQIRCKK